MAEQVAPKPKAQLDEEFAELYRTHLRDIYSYAYYRVGNHHDAEELTEQTFLQAYRHFERAQRESDGRPLRPWLIRIAHNLAANLYRDRSRKPVSPIDETTPLSALHTTEELVEDRDELSRVLACVRKLPDDRREALIMRFALGMDNREIARALGRSDGATKVLIHRAIKQLEGLVADDPEGAQAPAPAPGGKPRVPLPRDSEDKPVRVSLPEGSGDEPVRVSLPEGSGDEPVRVPLPEGSRDEPVRVPLPEGSRDEPVRVPLPEGSRDEPGVPLPGDPEDVPARAPASRDLGGRSTRAPRGSRDE